MQNIGFGLVTYPGYKTLMSTILLLIGGLFLGIGLYIIFKVKQQTYLETIAIITDINILSQVMVKYSINGKNYVSFAYITKTFSGTIGQQITIYYNIANPLDIYVYKPINKNIWGISCIVIGAIILFVSIFNFIFNFKSKTYTAIKSSISIP